jgi:hypothetical protein
MAAERPSNDPRHDETRESRAREPEEEERPRPRKTPRRPGLVIGPTTDDADVQLEW